METDPQLARFQAALLELLAGPLSTQEKYEHLQHAPEFEPYRAYVKNYDLRALETASELIRKWGRRTEN